ncbi:MAG: Lipase precursor [Labilithrix sp.]|nr:Lipase precursor [Labilithrix sp.]
MRHRLYLTPGMFGFGKLATYDYFAHVARALRERFNNAGEDLETHVVDVAPTASIRRRAARLAELVATTTRGDRGGGVGDPIHLLGHSTGGLDARLVASPSARLPVDADRLAWVQRLCSVTTMSTPHYGTPLASFFATVSGQRMLYAVSALTFIALSLGAPPLAAASALVVAIGQLDRAVLGMEIQLLDRTTELLLKALEPASSREVRDYLDAITKDQGAVIQLTPEAMDLFQSGVEDRPGVVYQSTCAMAPPPSARKLARAMLSPWRAVSSTLFTTLYGITSRVDDRYPCGAPEPAAAKALERAFGRSISLRANDGVVPTRSQAWGNIVWAGSADHLDVLGHYPSLEPDVTRLWSRWLDRLRGRPRAAGSIDKPGSPRWKAARAGEVATEVAVEGAVRSGGAAPRTDADTRHVDWLTSGAGFDDASFASLMDAVANGMLSAARDFQARRTAG